MKKTLLALAALAATSASFAQSSVTLYGVVDLSLDNVTIKNGTDKTQVTRLTSGTLATSRLGFKGTEDIGNGVKANFNLEAPVTADTGVGGTATSATTSTARLFDRQAWVGLSSSNLGEIRLGRTDTPIAAQAIVIGGQSFDDLVVAGARATSADFSIGGQRRIDNAITYNLPALVPGLAVQAQYSTAADAAAPSAEATAGSKQGRDYGFSAAYGAGPLSAALAYANQKVDATGATKITATFARGAYDLGVAKISAFYSTDKKTGDEKSLTVFGAKVDVPVNDALTITGGLSKAKNTSRSVLDTASDDATILSAKAVYALSKRTKAYAWFVKSNNQANAKTAIGGGSVGSTGQDPTGLSLGLSHAF